MFLPSLQISSVTTRTRSVLLLFSIFRSYCLGCAPPLPGGGGFGCYLQPWTVCSQQPSYTYGTSWTGPVQQQQQEQQQQQQGEYATAYVAPAQPQPLTTTSSYAPVPQKYPEAPPPPPPPHISSYHHSYQQQQVQVDAAKIQHETGSGGTAATVGDELVRNSIPQQPAAGSHGSSSFIQEQQSSAPLTVAAGEQAFQSDDSGGGGAQEGDQSLTTTAAAPPPPPINNKCCGVAVAVPRARSVQLPAAASGAKLENEAENQDNQQQLLARRFQLEQCERGLFVQPPSTRALVDCLEYSSMRYSSPAEAAGNPPEPWMQQCDFDNHGDHQRTTTHLCSFYSAKSQPIQFAHGHFLISDSNSDRIRQLFAHLAKRSPSDFPSGGFLVVDTGSSGSASLRLDVPCQQGDGLLSFDYWNMPANNDGGFPTLKVCTRQGNQRGCTKPIAPSPESSRVEVQVVNPAAANLSSLSSNGGEETNIGPREQLLSPEFTLEIALINSNDNGRLLPNGPNGPTNLLILDNLEYHARKCPPPPSPLPAETRSSATEENSPVEEVTAREPRIEIFPPAAIPPHFEEAGGGEEASGAATNDAIGGAVVNNESKRHTVAEPGTGGPPWDAAEETGQIGNEEDSKSEHFWRLTMAPPRPRGGKNRAAFFRREMPKLMVMPDPLQQQKPPNLNHQRTRLFGTRDEQAAFPQPQSTTEQQREDGKGESGFTKVIPIRREVSAGGYPNKLSLFRGVQSTIGNGNGKENEVPAENTPRNHLVGQIRQLDPCELLNCSFQDGTFCHWQKSSSSNNNGSNSNGLPPQYHFGLSVSNWRLSNASSSFIASTAAAADAANSTTKTVDTAVLRYARGTENGGFAFVGRPLDPHNATAGGCQHRRRQPQKQVVYIMESAPFTLDSEGLLQFDLFRSSGVNNAITIQVCMDTLQNCVYVGCPICGLGNWSPLAAQQPLIGGPFWRRESVRLIPSTKKLFIVATQWKPFNWLAVDNIRLATGAPCTALALQQQQQAVTKNNNRQSL